jgi:hypothetical protein
VDVLSGTISNALRNAAIASSRVADRDLDLATGLAREAGAATLVIQLATSRRKIRAGSADARIVQVAENCKVGRN